MFLFKAYKTGLLFVFFICATFYLQAQVNISAIPSKKVVQENETFQLEFVINGTLDVEQFTAPVFRNFELISGPNQSNGWTWVNGALSEYVSYSFLLRPKIKGRLPIASAIIKIKGKVFTSSPVVIQVSNTSAVSTNTIEEEQPDYYLLPGQSVKEKIAKNLILKATIDKQTCYVGEPVLATFKLYTRLESQSKVIKRPSLNGFSVIDLEEPEAGNFSKEMLNGRLYNCYLIRKVQLFPLQSGVLQIEPVEVENVVRFIKVAKRNNKETSTWLDAMMEKMKDADAGNDILEERFVLKSDELKLNVKELPEKNKPELFTGAVGNFTMEASLQQNEIALNDDAILHVVIKGNGNIPMLTAPAINWPVGVDSFEAKMNEQINKSTSPISGVKTFDFPFSVSDTGLVHIPAISFSFFDDSQSTYKTVTTEPLELKVGKAVKRKTPVISRPQVEETNSEVADWVWFAGIASLFVIAVGFMFIIKRKKVNNKTELVYTVNIEKEQIPHKSIAQYLHPAVEFQDGVHQKQFYTMLVNGMQQFFVDRLQLITISAGHSTIIEALKQKQFAAYAVKYQQIVDECEMIIFSGADVNDSKDQMLQNAIELMNEADRRFSI
jgi:BatD DUF11 like domain